MKKSFLPFLLLLALWSFQSCQKDQSPTSIVSTEDVVSETNVTNPDGAVTDRADCQQSITLPANSVDALAGALDNICTGGTIWLATGMHTENAGVVIKKQVTIKGQPGAVLKIQASPILDYSQALDVALHFNFGAIAKLENIDIHPISNPGGVAVLLEKSTGASVSNCHFTNFQHSILVQASVGTKLTNNVIVASNAWQTGAIPEAGGITIINGEGATIKGNEVSQALFGVWPCDRNGKYENNYTHHNYNGLILCKVPADGYILPSGQAVGAAFSSTRWKVQNNKSKNNLDAGYLVIDGSNNNQLINNEGGGNGTYDIELVGDSYRFGFLTPYSFKNTVFAGSFQNVTIKNCGQNNLIYGGVKVDTGVDACY